MSKINYLKIKECLNEDFSSIKKKININFLKKKKIIITGSSGGLSLYFINFLLFLNEKFKYKTKIIAITRNPSILKRKIFYKTYQMKILKININNVKIKPSIESDFFFHFSSPVDPKDYARYPNRVFMDIINSTGNVIKYIKKNSETKLIYSSSSEIYVRNVLNNDSKIFEPNSSYALGKMISEFMFLNEIKNKEKIINLRLFNFFSPLEDINNSRIIPSMIYQSIKNKNMIIKGDGTGIRYFSYVKDVVISILILLNKKTKRNIFDVGNPKNMISIKELGKEILKLNDKNEKKLILKKLFIDTKGVKPNVVFLKKEGFKSTYDLKKQLKRVFLIQKENLINNN